MENRTSAKVDDLFSFSFFALPTSAALGFKFFANVALRAKTLPTSGLNS